MTATEQMQAVSAAGAEPAELMTAPGVTGRQKKLLITGAAVVVVVQVGVLTAMVPPWVAPAAQADAPVVAANRQPAVAAPVAALAAVPDAARAVVQHGASTSKVTALASPRPQSQPDMDDLDSEIAAMLAATMADEVVLTVATKSAGDPSDSPIAAVAAAQPESAPVDAGNVAPPHAAAPAPAQEPVISALYPRPLARPAHLLLKRPVNEPAVSREFAVAHQPARPAKPTRVRNAGLPGTDVAWLLKQPGGHYTLQLVSVSDGARLQKFTRAVPPSRFIAHVKVRKAGGLRHVLYRGVYSNRARAQSDARLLARRTGVKPWIRRIAEVKRELGGA